MIHGSIRIINNALTSAVKHPIFIMQQPVFFSSRNAILSGLLFFTFISGVFATDTNANGPIVVTIKPLFSLVSHLTETVETPVLLMKQPQSPHHFRMRPSERHLLSNARMIVWTGPQMESYLSKIIQQQSKTTVIVTTMQADDIKLIAARKKHDRHEDKEGAVQHPEHHTIDPHLWLSTGNAIAISRQIAAALISSDPEHAVIYKSNLQQLVSKISQTKAHIDSVLKNRSLPFIAFHDAFQYFEAEFGLNYIDSISFDEESGVSLKHLRRIRKEIHEHNVRCLVYQEPKPAIVDSLSRQTSITASALDPLGLNINDNKNAWFEIMFQLSADFNFCLKP